jgi:zinc transport system substrate-binding protein
MIRTILAAAGLLAAGTSGAAAEPPRVVASILPVHSLTASVMEGVGAPYLLVPSGASPHSYALRPSDAEALERADLVFWVGPAISTFLEKPLASLSADAEVVALGRAEGLNLLPVREGGAFEAHDHDHGHGDHGHKDHDHGHKDHDDHGHKDHDDHGHKDHDHGHDAPEHPDSHVWLETGNAIAMANEIAAHLSEADPANAAAYRANAERLTQRLTALGEELAVLLSPVAGRPFIVFHDAWQHFERQFGLAAVGSITIDGHEALGARRVSRLKSRISDLGVVCIFAEPQFDDRIIATLSDGLPVRTGVADPLGSGAVQPGPGLYEASMREAAAAFRDCLEG